MGMYKHQARPKHGLLTRESDGETVDGTTPGHYPLLGECRSCNRVIRAGSPDDARWKHAGANTPNPPGHAQKHQGTPPGQDTP